MPPKPPPAPSRIEPVTFPVFGMSWFADPSDGRSITAYSGGGGSARTGVLNCIVVQDGDNEAVPISTGDKVGVAVCIYQNPASKGIFMVVAMDRQISRYILPPVPVRDSANYSQALADTLDNKESCNAIAVNVMADFLAVGCDNGSIHLYNISDNLAFERILQPTHVLQGHTECICSLSFSMKSSRLVSSAKDGTARVWNYTKDKESCISTLVCRIDEPKKPTPKKQLQILVRGCAFMDIDGDVVITVASARKGKAFLSKWIRRQQEATNNETSEHLQCLYECIQRIEISANPISAMSLSADGLLLALGSVSGSVMLFDVDAWKVLRLWNEIHDLPVTCIAARPYRLPYLYQGEESTQVSIHVRCASADSRLGCLTLQKKIPKKQPQRSPMTVGDLATSIKRMIHRLFGWSLFAFICYPIIHDADMKCHNQWHDTLFQIRNGHMQFEPFFSCLMNEVIIAPTSRPGIKSPLY